jgi:C4-dicarboxylate-specific signal transduction histidine kinase
VLNVLRNAIEALTPVDRREIRVDLRQKGERVILEISDSGSGIDPQLLARAGTPFYSTKENGLGMGLSISRSIAEQHGGTLMITNGNEAGAVVELNLPAAHKPDAQSRRTP